MKTCIKCGESRPLEDFWKNSSFADGRESTCKFCKNAKRRRAYQEDLEVNRERVRVAARHIYRQNPEKAKARRERYESKDPERIRAMKDAWKQAHPDRLLDYDQARRARVRGTQIEPISRRLVWEQDEGICHICLESVEFEDMHLDHVVPLSKGGTHTYDNVASSHEMCNLKKAAKVA